MYIQYVCMFTFHPFNKDSCCLETSFLKGLIHVLCVNWSNIISCMKLLLRNYDFIFHLSLPPSGERGTLSIEGEFSEVQENNCESALKMIERLEGK